jgi:carboxymethylenebutenolidase
MRRRLLFLAVAALATMGGCDDKPTTTSAPAKSASVATAASTVAPTATTSAAATKAPTGVLSEEDFKKLHVLKDADAPAPKGKMIELGSERAYLSLPAGKKPPLPAVVVIHEWWGLNQHIKHWSDRLAEAGYAALAVDLYGGEVATEPDQAMRLMKAVDADAARKTLLAAYAYLADNEAVKAKKRASIGWCFGGKWSLELALAAPDLDAAVVYYGHVERSPARLAKLQAPLLAFFGNQDKGIPPKMVDELEFGLEQAGDKNFVIHRFEAEHAFANPSSGRYDMDAASEAWDKVQEFLRENLSDG